ncbi:MAG: hypothetical protein JKY53_05265 [Flavobacteriales bacterium]|nr:hypothetical protein [Flavobacteriales bacterium]
MMTEKERELTQDMLNLIDRIKSKTDYLNTDGRIPELELEVILSKIEQLHQKAIGLKYLHQFADGISASITEQKQEIVQEITPPELHKIDVEEDIVKEIVAENNTQTNEVPLETITQDINSLGGGNGEGIIEKLQQTPISDIKSAIGINDKFLFINELFNGDSKKFGATIDLLNQCSSMEEAQQNLGQFAWDGESETTQSFIKLVSRKYL